jgi:tRNA A37 N6-isopentenylltransferase MiaA
MNTYLRTTQHIHQKGKVPIIVGGTAFYLNCYIYNTVGGSAPVVLPALRQQIKNQVRKLGWDERYLLVC